ncbi:MAG: glycosyltransferase, partial [Candidatus Omnitrophica bacterium CG07_land_8_20_14_0_80_50_8]
MLPLYGELKEIFQLTDRRHEIIFVNDGSSDDSLLELETIVRKDKKVKVINFLRNFGQTTAMSAAISYS